MHTLILSDEDLVIIERAISEMPFRLAAPLVQKINEQLAAASAEKEEA